MDQLLDKIYYLLFVGMGLFMIRYRDVWASKIVESQRMADFLFKRAKLNKETELTYTRGLCVVVSLAFIIFGIFKLTLG